MEVECRVETGVKLFLSIFEGGVKVGEDGGDGLQVQQSDRYRSRERDEGSFKILEGDGQVEEIETGKLGCEGRMLMVISSSIGVIRGLTVCSASSPYSSFSHPCSRFLPISTGILLICWLYEAY